MRRQCGTSGSAPAPVFRRALVHHLGSCAVWTGPGGRVQPQIRCTSREHAGNRIRPPTEWCAPTQPISRRSRTNTLRCGFVTSRVRAEAPPACSPASLALSRALSQQFPRLQPTAAGGDEHHAALNGGLSAAFFAPPRWQLGRTPAGARIPRVQDPSTVTGPDPIARHERRGGEGAACALASQLSARERIEDYKPHWVECGDVAGVASDQGAVLMRRAT